jgi:hypothetical protein
MKRVVVRVASGAMSAMRDKAAATHPADFSANERARSHTSWIGQSKTSVSIVAEQANGHCLSS